MENNNNCWDFMKCTKDEQRNCTAFLYDMGKDCWMVAGSFNRKPSCIKAKKGLSCIECPWFKKTQKILPKK